MCWVTARLSALTFRLRHRPAAKCRRKEPPAISWQCAEEKTLQGCRGARRESRETHGCLLPHSLSQGDSSDPVWHFGCCTGGVSPAPLVPGTGNRPDLSPTSPLPCWTLGSFMLGLQTWQSPPGKGGWRGPCALRDLGCRAATSHRRGEAAEGWKNNRITGVRL